MPYPKANLMRDYELSKTEIPKKGFEIVGTERELYAVGSNIYTFKIDTNIDDLPDEGWVFWQGNKFIGDKWWIFSKEEKRYLKEQVKLEGLK